MHADDGYSRCKNVGSLLFRNIVSLIRHMAPINAMVQEVENGRCGGLKVVKPCSYGDTSYSLVQTPLLYDVLFSHNALRHRHRQTDRQTDRRKYHASITDHLG